jgi:His-Xaa-Ser system radical SAM maturase HxsB
MAKKKAFKIVNYRFKKINDKYFISTDNGSCSLLDEKDFDLLKSEKPSGKLYDSLEDCGIIITQKNQNEIIEKTRKKYGFLFNGTSLHIVVATLRCNMKCVYCQASSVDPSRKEYDMDLKTAKKTVDFIFQTPAKSITIEFQGGEPLINFDVVKFITQYSKESNKKHKKDLKITLVTNLNAIDEQKLDFLIKENISICTSLDGPKFIHDSNRPLVGNAGSYDSVIRWISKINEKYKKRKIKNNVNALITITKKTLDYPKPVIDEYVKNKVFMIHLRPLTSLGCASSSWEKIGYTSDQFVDFWKKCLDYMLELNNKGVMIKERMAIIMLKKILSLNLEEDYLDLRSPCGAAIGQLLYNYDGNIYTCDEGRMIGNEIFKLGNVDEKYKDLMTSKQACAIVSSSINDNFICDTCSYNPYCGICPVCNYAEQGSIIADILKTSRCKIYMAMFDYLVEKYFFDDGARNIFDNWLYNK